MGAKDMVMFRMPDGTEVSNDPRFDLDEALTKSLNSRETTGSVGPTWDEQNAQIIAEKMAALNSTQPGVGENATVDDPTKELHGVLGSPAQQRQVEDVAKAQEAGASPFSTSTEDEEPVDSNERVLAVREQVAKDREAYAKAVDKLGDEGPGDPEQPYSEWSPKQLVAEVHRRNADEGRAEEDRIVLEKNTRAKAEEALEADDQAQTDRTAAQAAASAGQAQG